MLCSTRDTIEERDYIHIVDTTSDYKQAQKIDFIGDISGISLTPDAEGLFVGVSSVDFSYVLLFLSVSWRVQVNCELTFVSSAIW